MADQKQGLKVIKKKWFPIFASKEFEEANIGESLVASASDLVGRIVSVNLMSLTNDIKLQHITLKFKIIGADNDKATADLIGFEIIPPAIRRLVRRGVDRIDDSFICETVDNKKIRVKPFILTKSYARGLVGNRLRKAMIDYIAKEAKKVTFDDLVKNLLGNKFQTSIKAELKKIYPIKSCEIKSVSVVLKGKPMDVKEDKLTEEAPEEA